MSYAHDGTAKGIAAAIVQLVRDNRGGVSFAEIENHIPGCTGEHQLSIAESNIVLWQLSEAAAQAMNLLQGPDSPIVPHPTSPMVYAFDGAGLSLPLAKGRPPKGGFKKPRWLPVVFNLREQTRTTTPRPRHD